MSTYSRMRRKQADKSGVRRGIARALRWWRLGRPGLVLALRLAGVR